MLSKKIVMISSFLLFFSLQPAFAGVFFNDSFESGNLSYTGSTGAKWTSSGNTSVSNKLSHSGSYALKFFFKGNTDLSADSSAEQRFNLGSNKDEVYIRYYIYLPSNYTIRDSGGANNTKMIRLWGNDYTNPNKVGMSIFNGLSVAIESKIGNWPSELTCSGNMGPVPNGWASLGSEYLGKWTSLEYHFKKDSGSGDGVFQLHVNGVLKIDLKNQSWVGAPCSPAYFLNGYLMGWSNSGFSQDTTVYIDDVVFSDAPIGLGESSTNLAVQVPDVVQEFQAN
jgi:hypothetical protein